MDVLRRLFSAQLLLRRLKQAASFVVWRPRFGSFGAGSMVGRSLRTRGLEHVHLGERVQLGPLWRIEAFADGAPPLVAVGPRTTAEIGLHIAATSGVRIGADCLIASWVFITDHHHGFAAGQVPRHAPLANVKPVVVGDGCWLGERCVLMPGVTLGEGCVVGANAVVTRSFPAGTILAGIPARAIRQRGTAA